MIQKHGTVAVAGTTSGVQGPLISGVMLNGLLLSISATATVLASHTFSVMRVRENGERVLHYNKFSMADLTIISDLEAGIKAIEGTESRYLLVDLGCLHLGADRLEVTFDNAEATTRSISVYSYTVEDDIDYEVVCERTNVLVGSFDDVDKLFIKTGGTDCDITITAEGNVYTCDTLGLNVANACLFEAESSAAVAGFGCAYANRDGIPDRVDYRITSSASLAAVYVIAKRKVFGRKVSKTSVENTARLAQKLQVIEGTNPAKARALRHAGRAPMKSAELFRAANVTAVANVQKGLNA